MQYPKIDVYALGLPLIQKFSDDEAVVDLPVWRCHDDEFTQRIRFNNVKLALLYVRRHLRRHHFAIHDGHRWHEIFIDPSN